MIDLQTEDVLTLNEAAKILPKRNGKRPAFSTLFRWAKHGLSGVRLETIRIGGSLCTSREALQRFCERRTEIDSQAPMPSDKKRAQQAEAELARMGI